MRPVRPYFVFRAKALARKYIKRNFVRTYRLDSEVINT